jgi:hypothetical protein
MTCDEVFDLLTLERSAEDHRSRDALLEHVAGCRSCRRLADALEPAVELFRQCAASESNCASTLDGPWSSEEHSSPKVGTAKPGSAWTTPLDPPAVPWLWQLLGPDMMRLAAALLVGLTLGALVWGQTNEHPKTASRLGGLAISSPTGASTPRITLAALRLTSECVPTEHRAESANSGPRLRPAAELLASNNLDALACCTLCHASQRVIASGQSATRDVLRSCQACHTF